MLGFRNGERKKLSYTFMRENKMGFFFGVVFGCCVTYILFK